MSVVSTLFEHKDFGGRSFTWDDHAFRTRFFRCGGDNDMYSSMRLWGRGQRANAYAFENIDFDGRFAALNVQNGGASWWSYFGDSFNDVVSSALLIAREPESRETVLSLGSLVVGQFGALFDARAAGQPISRDGDSRVYGTFFPSFDSQRIFATIDQKLTVQVRIPLKVHIPILNIDIDAGTFRWSDYHARVRYHVSFSASDGKLHGRVAWVSVWVESGAFSGRVFDGIKPPLVEAASSISAAIEGSLGLFRSKVADVYLLPGSPPDMSQFGAMGRYDDDVCLVVVKG